MANKDNTEKLAYIKLYEDMWKTCKASELSFEEFGELQTIVCAYAFDGEMMTSENRMIKGLASSFISRVEYDREKHREKCEKNRANAKLSHKGKQTKPTEATEEQAPTPAPGERLRAQEARALIKQDDSYTNIFRTPPRDISEKLYNWYIEYFFSKNSASTWCDIDDCKKHIINYWEKYHDQIIKDRQIFLSYNEATT